MKRLILLLLLSLCAAFSALAQPPDTLWTHTYGGINDDYITRVIQTDGDGYVFVGETFSFGLMHDAWITKTDNSGTIVWDTTLGGPNPAHFESVIETSTGDLVAVGHHRSNGPGQQADAWLVKFNAAGVLQWQQTYGGTGYDDMGLGVVARSDGGFNIVGWTTTYSINHMQDLWLIKTDSFGIMQWDTTLGGSSADVGFSIQNTNDMGYILGGWTHSNSAGQADFWLVKMNSSYSVEWDTTYGGPLWDLAFNAQQTFDGGYIVTGWTESYGAGGIDYWLIKTTSSGSIQWTKTFGGPQNDFGCIGQQTDDGGYCIIGRNESVGNGQAWLIKTNANGDSVWSVFFGSEDYESGYSVLQTNDGGYIIGGNTQGYGLGGDDGWLILLEGGLSVTLTPYNPPIVIPQAGGSFSFNYNAHNASNSPIPFDTWLVVTVPGGFPFTVLGPFYNLTLPGGASLVRDRSVNVPATAPAGQYSCMGVVGNYPWNIIDSDAFTFTKEGTNSDWLGSEGWLCTGDPFPCEIGGTRFVVSQNGEESDTTKRVPPNINPNPFNPTTFISFELRAASFVRLRVYDTAGRLIETLVDGWREADAHEVTFDGSALPSGVYLYRLEAGEFTTSGKMVLLK